MADTRLSLTAKQKLFAKEYLVDLNATQAAIRAGYSEKTASRIGPELLGKTCIAEAIQKAQDKRLRRIDISQDDVVNELANIAFGDVRAVMSWDENGVTLKDSSSLTDSEVAMVSEVSSTITKDGGTMRVKRHDKVKALELLGKHLGMFRDRVEVSGTDGAPIQHDMTVSAATESFLKRLQGTSEA